jgi:CspA family cold shock protein
VKWFKNQTGFGFTAPDNSSKKVFVHISAVERAGMSTLQEGQKLLSKLPQTAARRRCAPDLPVRRNSLRQFLRFDHGCAGKAFGSEFLVRGLSACTR